LGTTDHQNVEKLAFLLLEKKIPEALGLVNDLTNSGNDLEIFNKSFLNYLRQLLILSVDEKLGRTLSLELTSEQIKEASDISKNNTGEILKILENFSEIQNKIRSSFIPQLPLEMAIVKMQNYELASSPVSQSGPQIIEPGSSNNQAIRQNTKDVEKEIEKDEKKETHTEKIATSKPEKVTSGNISISIDEIRDKWKEIIRETKPFNHSISLFLLNCEPWKVEENYLFIVTKYKFYKDKLEETGNKLTIEKVLAKIFGSGLRPKFVSEDEAGVKVKTPARKDSPSSPASIVKPKETSSLLNDAMEMMGGKIVEE
jgi:DNA polymerase III gamma/tau subunit